MVNHSVNVTEQATSVVDPVVVNSGIPFVVGTAPVQTAANPAKAGIPILCKSWDEAVDALGYSNDWATYTLCEFMYSHFKLFGCQPVIFLNAFDATYQATAVPADDIGVDETHKVSLPYLTIDNNSLEVKAPVEGGSPVKLTKGTDYITYYTDSAFFVELLPTSSKYDATTLNIKYSKVNTSAWTAASIASAVEYIELCLTKVGVVPDLICVPGYSGNTAVAAAMAAKAASINGLFKAKALIDIYGDPDTGAIVPGSVPAKKDELGFTSADEIVCWPMVKKDGKLYHLSTQLAGLLAQVDNSNDGCPYESPSNKNLQADALVLDGGTEIDITLAQANTLMANGVVTALNFVNGWTAWGNYTACYPGNSDIKDNLISVSRSFDWVGNTLIKTFWQKLDNPMSRRLIDTIIDAANIWLNGLVGRGYFYGARVEMLESENPMDNLMAGIVKLHVYLAPASPTQEIDFVLEYDADYVVQAFTETE